MQVENSNELVAFGTLSYRRRIFSTSVRLWTVAFEKSPSLLEEMQAGHRYNAACSAALAAAGEGNDAKDLTDDQRKELRQKCLAWLRDDLAARKKAADKGDAKVKQAMAAHWANAQKDPDLAGVRDATALKKLSGNERAAWQALWDETKSVRNSLMPKP